MEFGSYLRKSRREKGWTIIDLSERTNIDAGLLSKIERGKRMATREQSLKMIHLLDLKMDKIMPIWLSTRILYDLEGEDYASEALSIVRESMDYSMNYGGPDQIDSKIRKLLKKADLLKKEWADSKPLDQTQLRKLKEYFEIQYTYESNRIEGNTLTLQETHLVVKEGLTIGGKSIQEHLEAINHVEAIEYISEIIQDNIPITESVLSKIHYLILKGIDSRNAGKYRTVNVRISGSNHKPPQPFMLGKMMEDLFLYYISSKERLHPIILAAEMHERLVTIHPFIDGNGRTSRLLMNLILIGNGFPTTILKGDFNACRSYYNGLEAAREDATKTLFYELICEQVIYSLEEHIALT